MSAIIDFVPHMLFEGATYQQPLHSVVDVSGYTDAAIFLHVPFADLDNNPAFLRIKTAADNREDRYRQILYIELDPAEISLPYCHMVYLTAAGDSGDFHGFDRYLRIELECNGEQKVAFDVRGLMRTRS